MKKLKEKFNMFGKGRPSTKANTTQAQTETEPTTESGEDCSPKPPSQTTSHGNPSAHKTADDKHPSSKTEDYKIVSAPNTCALPQVSTVSESPGTSTGLKQIPVEQHTYSSKPEILTKKNAPGIITNIGKMLQSQNVFVNSETKLSTATSHTSPSDISTESVMQAAASSMGSMVSTVSIGSIRDLQKSTTSLECSQSEVCSYLGNEADDENGSESFHLGKRNKVRVKFLPLKCTESTSSDENASPESQALVDRRQRLQAMLREQALLNEASRRTFSMLAQDSTLAVGNSPNMSLFEGLSMSDFPGTSTYTSTSIVGIHLSSSLPSESDGSGITDKCSVQKDKNCDATGNANNPWNKDMHHASKHHMRSKHDLDKLSVCGQSISSQSKPGANKSCSVQKYCSGEALKQCYTDQAEDGQLLGSREKYHILPEKTSEGQIRDNNVLQNMRDIASSKSDVCGEIVLADTFTNISSRKNVDPAAVKSNDTIIVEKSESAYNHGMKVYACGQYVENVNTKDTNKLSQQRLSDVEVEGNVLTNDIPDSSYSDCDSEKESSKLCDRQVVDKGRSIIRPVTFSHRNAARLTSTNPHSTPGIISTKTNAQAKMDSIMRRFTASPLGSPQTSAFRSKDEHKKQPNTVDDFIDLWSFNTREDICSAHRKLMDIITFSRHANIELSMCGMCNMYHAHVDKRFCQLMRRTTALRRFHEAERTHRTNMFHNVTTRGPALRPLIVAPPVDSIGTAGNYQDGIEQLADDRLDSETEAPVGQSEIIEALPPLYYHSLKRYKIGTLSKSLSLLKNKPAASETSFKFMPRKMTFCTMPRTGSRASVKRNCSPTTDTNLNTCYKENALLSSQSEVLKRFKTPQSCGSALYSSDSAEDEFSEVSSGIEYEGRFQRPCVQAENNLEVENVYASDGYICEQTIEGEDMISLKQPSNGKIHSGCGHFRQLLTLPSIEDEHGLCNSLKIQTLRGRVLREGHRLSEQCPQSPVQPLDHTHRSSTDSTLCENDDSCLVGKQSEELNNQFVNLSSVNHTGSSQTLVSEHKSMDETYVVNKPDQQGKTIQDLFERIQADLGLSTPKADLPTTPTDNSKSIINVNDSILLDNILTNAKQLPDLELNLTDDSCFRNRGNIHHGQVMVQKVQSLKDLKSSSYQLREPKLTTVKKTLSCKLPPIQNTTSMKTNQVMEEESPPRKDGCNHNSIYTFGTHHNPTNEKDSKKVNKSENNLNKTIEWRNISISGNNLLKSRDNTNDPHHVANENDTILKMTFTNNEFLRSGEFSAQDKSNVGTDHASKKKTSFPKNSPKTKSPFSYHVGNASVLVHFALNENADTKICKENSCTWIEEQRCNLRPQVREKKSYTNYETEVNIPTAVRIQMNKDSPPHTKSLSKAEVAFKQRESSIAKFIERNQTLNPAAQVNEKYEINQPAGFDKQRLLSDTESSPMRQNQENAPSSMKENETRKSTSNFATECEKQNQSPIQSVELKRENWSTTATESKKPDMMKNTELHFSKTEKTPNRAVNMNAPEKQNQKKFLVKLLKLEPLTTEIENQTSDGSCIQHSPQEAQADISAEHTISGEKKGDIVNKDELNRMLFHASCYPSRAMESWEQAACRVRNFVKQDPRRVASTSNLHKTIAIQKLFVQKAPLFVTGHPLFKDQSKGADGLSYQRFLMSSSGSKVRKILHKGLSVPFLTERLDPLTYGPCVSTTSSVDGSDEVTLTDVSNEHSTATHSGDAVDEGGASPQSPTDTDACEETHSGDTSRGATPSYPFDGDGDDLFAEFGEFPDFMTDLEEFNKQFTCNANGYGVNIDIKAN